MIREEIMNRNIRQLVLESVVFLLQQRFLSKAESLLLSNSHTLKRSRVSFPVSCQLVVLRKSTAQLEP